MKDFNQAFNETYWTLFDKPTKVKKWSYAADGIIYRMVNHNTYWISIPGVTKDGIEAKIEGKKLKLSWDETKYLPDVKNNVYIPMVEGTKNVSVEVDNGVVIVVFETTPSDISVEIK